jgi:hypothetical protein
LLKQAAKFLARKLKQLAPGYAIDAIMSYVHFLSSIKRTEIVAKN